MQEEHEILLKIETQVKELLEFKGDIAPDAELKEIGMASMKTMELLVVIENVFDVTFDDDEILLENFSTLTKVTRMVLNKQLSQGAFS